MRLYNTFSGRNFIRGMAPTVSEDPPIEEQDLRGITGGVETRETRPSTEPGTIQLVEPSTILKTRAEFLTDSTGVQVVVAMEDRNDRFAFADAINKKMDRLGIPRTRGVSVSLTVPRSAFGRFFPRNMEEVDLEITPSGVKSLIESTRGARLPTNLGSGSPNNEGFAFFS